LSLLLLAGLLWIVAFKINDVIIVASSPVKAHCSLVKSESNGGTSVRIQLQTGNDELRSVHLAINSEPPYGNYQLSYGPLKSESTTLRNETLNYPHAVDGVSCWVAGAVFKDGREWHAPYRSPIIP
jgi:hypothetical protein